MTIDVSDTPIILGAGLDAVDTTDKAGLGKTVKVSTTNMEGEATYIEALSILSQYNWVAIAEDGKASNLTIANMTDATGIGRKVGVVQQSVPSGSFAWAYTRGKVTGKVAQACADRVPLFPTTTPGVVDDATSSVGILAGCYTVTTTSTASAITVVMATTAFTFPWSNPA